MNEFEYVICGSKISESDFRQQNQKCEICMLRANPVLQIIGGLIIGGIISYLEVIYNETGCRCGQIFDELLKFANNNEQRYYQHYLIDYKNVLFDTLIVLTVNKLFYQPHHMLFCFY